MKDYLTTYIAVVLAGLTLMFIQDQYVKSQLDQFRKATSNAAEQSYEEREQTRRAIDASQKMQIYCFVREQMLIKILNQFRHF